MTSGDDAMPWNGQSLARPDDELLERRLPQELAGRLAERHHARRDRPAASDRAALSLFVPTSTTPFATDGIAVALRSERRDPLDVLAGLHVPRRRQARRVGHHVAIGRSAPHRPVGDAFARARRGSPAGRDEPRRKALTRFQTSLSTCFDPQLRGQVLPLLSSCKHARLSNVHVRVCRHRRARRAVPVRDLVGLLDRPLRPAPADRAARPCPARASCRRCDSRRAASCGTRC